jgi:hypothetical protein
LQQEDVDQAIPQRTTAAPLKSSTADPKIIIVWLRAPAVDTESHSPATLHIISRTMFSANSHEIVEVVERGVKQY